MSAPISARPRSPLPEPVHQTAPVAYAAMPPNLQPLNDAEIKVLTPALRADIDHAVDQYLSENPGVSLTGQELESAKEKLLQDVIAYLKTYGVEKPGGPITLKSLKEVGYNIPVATVGGFTASKTCQYPLPMVPTVCVNLKALSARDPLVVKAPRNPTAPPGANIGRTSPEVLEKINADLGTQVNFAYLSRWEGGQHLYGNIPVCKTKTGGKEVCGNSGLTIATGFDVGQRTAAELRRLGFDERIVQTLLPYVNLTKAAALNKLNADKAAGRPPFLYKSEADMVDGIVKKAHLMAAIEAYNNATGRDGAFQQLTPAQQTVLFSRTFHQGPGMHKTATAKQFYAAAVRGDWKAVETHLRNYPVSVDWYKNRVNQEADLLEEERRRTQSFKGTNVF